MSLHAAGSYIRTLREARHLTRDGIASAAGTSGSQVERIENGKQETRSSVLFGLARAVHGSVEQLQRLLLDEAATTDDGVIEATHWLAQERYGGNRALGEPQIAAFGKTKLFGRLLPTSAEELAQLVPTLVPYPRAAHIYEGWRDGTNSVRVLVDGQKLRVVIGAPNALYEWGFGGSGPALLAHALLRHQYGDAVLEHYGQRFATDVIARLPRQLGGLEWLLDSDEIALWFALVRLLENERGERSKTR